MEPEATATPGLLSMSVQLEEVHRLVPPELVTKALPVEPEATDVPGLLSMSVQLEEVHRLVPPELVT